MQIPSEQWDYLGRWRVADVGGAYVRTARQVVVGIQCEIVKYVRGGGDLQETTAQERYRAHLQAKRMPGRRD